MDDNKHRVSFDLDGINRMLGEGYNKKQIAELAGITIASLEKRMRTQGGRWDRVTGRFVPANVPPHSHIVEGRALPTRAVQVVQMLRSVTVRPEDVVRRLMFRDESELAQYMKECGLVWDSDVHNYVLAGTKEPATPGISESEKETTKNLIEMLREVLEGKRESTQPSDIASADGQTKVPSIPRYKNSSRRAPKCTHMAENIQDMLEYVSKGTKIPQCEIVEIALIDFCRKYGFREQIDTVLG